MDYNVHRQELLGNGFTVINKVFSADEIDAIKKLINDTELTNPLFRRTADLFAIRQVLKEIRKVISKKISAY